jgi:hypothetical protein
MSSTYRYQEPTARTFSVLPTGDYIAVITAAEEPYEKGGKLILKVQLSIQPSGSTVFYYPWAGATAAGEIRDSIGELLFAANRAPASGEEPNWAKLVGAKIKVRLKVEPDQMGIDRNAVHYVHTPKKADTVKPTEKGFSQSEFLKARGKQIEASGGEPEPDSIPYACDRG